MIYTSMFTILLLILLCIILLLKRVSQKLLNRPYVGLQIDMNICDNMSMEQILKDAIDTTCGVNFPRNIVSICEKLNITVQETGQFSDDISGVIFKENGKYIILVNKFHSIGRKSFTIAHELGHYFLHRELLDSNSEMVSYIKSNSGKCPALARGCEYNQRETEANKFAAELLMPTEEFNKKCETANSIEEVSAYFGVSIQAATIRAQQTGGWFFL